MMTRSAPGLDPVSRPTTFSVARRLESDEEKGRFEAALAKIAKAKPASK
jgi:hypothetical protein